MWRCLLLILCFFPLNQATWSTVVSFLFFLPLPFKETTVKGKEREGKERRRKKKEERARKKCKKEVQERRARKKKEQEGARKGGQRK